MMLKREMLTEISPYLTLDEGIIEGVVGVAVDDYENDPEFEDPETELATVVAARVGVEGLARLVADWCKAVESGTCLPRETSYEVFTDLVLKNLKKS